MRTVYSICCSLFLIIFQLVTAFFFLSVMIDDDFEGVTFSHLIFKSRLYDALGTCVIILNCLILTVICTDNFLKRKMVLYGFMAIADGVSVNKFLLNLG